MCNNTGTYDEPEVYDFGDLIELTAACQGFGGEDGGAKGYPNTFNQSQPDFGDPGFCS